MGDAQDAQAFLDIFDAIRDPRVARTRLHPLSSILFLCLCAVICGADSVVAIHRFGVAKAEFLSRMMPFPNGIPSHDTICRVLAKLNPFEFERMFTAWMAAVVELSDGGLVAIDGKTHRRAWDKSNGGEFVHMVSAFATANRLVLGQVRTDAKSNEITAIPHLLELLALKDCLVTIDAMGCQVAIAEKIISKDADYILAVKANQPKLHGAVLAAFEKADGNPAAKKHLDFVESQEFNHGREEVRRCTVLAVTVATGLPTKWDSAQSLVRIETERTLDGITGHESRYHVCSRALSAPEAQAAIRGHWGIENGLHWVLDVAFREDDSRVRTENAAECLGVIRHMALNLLRGLPSKVGIKTRRLEAACSEHTLLAVLGSFTN